MGRGSNGHCYSLLLRHCQSTILSRSFLRSLSISRQCRVWATLSTAGLMTCSFLNGMEKYSLVLLNSLSAPCIWMKCSTSKNFLDDIWATQHALDVKPDRMEKIREGLSAYTNSIKSKCFRIQFRRMGTRNMNSFSQLRNLFSKRLKYPIK